VEPDHGRRAKAILARVALFVAVAAVYFGIGMAFIETQVFSNDADLFDADMRRVVHDIARRDGVHYRTKVHPLFVLFFNPIGVFLKTWMVRPRAVAVLLNAAAAALGVVLFRELLIRLGMKPGRAGLWTAVFALSASQVFFGVFPETFAFSAAGLLLLFVTFSAKTPSRLGVFLSSLVAFGITTVNLVASLLLSILRQPPGTPPRRAVGRAITLGAAVVAAAVALSLVQKAYAPSTEVFFLPSSLAEEATYTSRPQSVGAAAVRAGDLVRSALFTSLAASALAIRRPADLPPVTRFGGWSVASAIHALVWLALLLGGARAWRLRQWRGQPLVRALVLWVAFNLALYSFYGTTFFLYSGQWTFAVLALAASALEDGLSDRHRRASAIALLALVSLQLWTNGALLLELHRLYR
jgi:hypothetical protein